MSALVTVSLSIATFSVPDFSLLKITSSSSFSIVIITSSLGATGVLQDSVEELLLSVVVKKPFINSSEAAGNKLELEYFLGVVGWAGDGGLSVAVQGTVGVVVKSGVPSDGKVRVISDRETEDSLETTCSDLIDIAEADEGEGGWVPVSDSSFTEHSGTDGLVAQLSCFNISGDPDFR